MPGATRRNSDRGAAGPSPRCGRARRRASGAGSRPDPLTEPPPAGAAERRPGDPGHDEHRPVADSGPLDIEVDLHQPRTADLAALIPGIARTGRAVTFTAENMTAAYGLLQLLALLTYVGP
ncbi:hypothetical protein AB0K16_19905 [Nonomuraea jabiensis]|uniref:hypothetical protein n=1 Tax=Nonomuraea jabiensis TaxID=882448 RepID=UPI00343A5A32